MAAFSKTFVFGSAVILSLFVALFFVLLQGSNKTDFPASALVNGTTLPSSNTNGTRVCLVSLIDVEEDDEQKASYNQERDILVCQTVTETYDTGLEDTFLTIRNVGDHDIASNREAIRQNQWFIEYSDDWVEQGSHHLSKIIAVPAGQSITTVDPSHVANHHSVDPQHRRKLVSGFEERQRRLGKTRGKHTVVVVSIDLSTSNQKLYNNVFGSTNSLKSQMEDCSQGQVEIVPHPQYPIINVRPSRDTSKYNFVDLYTDVLQDIKKELGLRNGQSVTSVTDHLMLIVPDSIDRRPGELGWGATPGFFAGIIESLAPSTMTMLHEIGHNFGLGHAYEDGIAYSDMSTVMGYSHRNVVKMCYNGQNMYSLGWFQNRTYDVTLRENRFDREVIDLAFYGDYAKTTSREPVMVRYKDIFLTFNRRRGINVETKEYPDMLLVVQQQEGEHHPYSNLETALAVGSNAYQKTWITTNPNNGGTDYDSIYIEVCSFTEGDAVAPDLLTISVGRQAGGCPHESVASSINRQNNRGNSQVTPQEPLECRMQWPWVEIHNPYYTNDISYLLCQKEVKVNPGQYCELTDGLSEMPVWKICRLECPQSNCVEQGEDFAEVSLVSAPERNVRNGDQDECQNLFSEVDIEVLEGDNSPVVTKTCEELGVGFLQTRKFYCDKVDLNSQLRVSDICKRECPENYCSQQQQQQQP